jgi:hypothetical protein
MDCRCDLVGVLGVKEFRGLASLFDVQSPQRRTTQYDDMTGESVIYLPPACGAFPDGVFLCTSFYIKSHLSPRMCTGTLPESKSKST